MDLAITIKNGWKSYNSTPALEGINISVPSGAIYGLLGASGCGKTTLLSCIVGTKKLDSGNLTVLGRSPGNLGNLLGYMPQDLALYDFFTITEILKYYGRIGGMSNSEINARTEFLATFLALPKGSRIVDGLSGGEARRVSLAIALIYRPRLLVLDEPTVGIDPLLRESVWRHLKEIVANDNTTLVITTHYIEEARQSLMVGVMRNGRILAEENPETLLSKYNVPLLNDVILQLCKDDVDSNLKLLEAKVDTVVENLSGANNSILATGYVGHDPLDFDTDVAVLKIRRFSNVSSSSHHHFSSSKHKHFWPMYESKLPGIVAALVARNIIRLKRRWPLLFMQFFLPIMQIASLHYVYGLTPKQIPVGVVSEDWNMLSSQNATADFKQFWEHCDASKKSNTGCLNKEIDGVCNYLRQFDWEISWVLENSKENALLSVTEGRSVGFIEFPFNYTKHLMKRGVFGRFADNQTLEGSQIGIRLDYSNRVSVSLLLKSLLEKFQKFAEQNVVSCGGNPSAARVPMQTNPIYGTMDDPDGVLTAAQPIVFIVTIFTMSLIPGLRYLMERTAGLVERDIVAGVKTKHVLLSSVGTDSVTLLLQIAVFLVMLVFGYEMKIEGSVTLVTALAFVTGVNGVCIGFLLTAFTDEVLGWTFSAMFLNCLIFVSTGVWPLATVPYFYRMFCYALPVSYPAEAVASIIMKGWNLSHPSVLLGFFANVVWITASLLLTLFIFSRKNQH